MGDGWTLIVMRGGLVYLQQYSRRLCVMEYNELTVSVSPVVRQRIFSEIEVVIPWGEVSSLKRNVHLELSSCFDRE